jgi:hydroxymethylpyrimidine kinase/phosphomethylpyrimidine kinase
MNDTGSFRPVVLTIAGSDSGGGAGIQADLKAITAVGAWGATAITCLTSQNLDGVRSLQPTEPAILSDQIDAVCEGFDVRAVKTGMLFSAELIQVVASRLAVHDSGPLVVDPVMVATSGAKLLQADAIHTLCEELLPHTTVITPNLHETGILAGFPVNDLASMDAGARAIHNLGASHVLVKGGHLAGEAVDLLFDGRATTEFRSPRIPASSASHGTGCTLAAAIAGGLARGLAVSEAVAQAKKVVHSALENRCCLGGGIEGLELFPFPVEE